jgi:membrane protease YdiL (CAAX protease family)
MNIKVRRFFQSAFLLYFCIKISIIISFFSSIYTGFLWKYFFHEKNIDIYNSIFYSYPLLLGILLSFYNPALFGLKTGKTFKYWKLTLLYILIIVVPLLTYFGTGAETPFYGMSWQVFILAPVGEELIFRGAFFTGINYLLKRIYEEDSVKIVIMTIIFSAVTFGIWHIQNVMVEPDYTGSQIVYTTLIGLLLGHLRYKTESLFSCIFIHALINLLATLN